MDGVETRWVLAQQRSERFDALSDVLLTRAEGVRIADVGVDMPMSGSVLCTDDVHGVGVDGDLRCHPDGPVDGSVRLSSLVADHASRQKPSPAMSPAG